MDQKPKLRGLLHLVAFVVTLAAAPILIAAARPQRRVDAVIYSLALGGLFATSAAYHRPDWGPVARRWMRKLDHSMIYVLIAGTYTPMLGTVSRGSSSLRTMWILAVVGIVTALAPMKLPKPVTIIPYIALGWFGVIGLPTIFERLGASVLALILAGGVLYTIGAIAYARRSPNPVPGVLGYHEVFHALVVLAAACHFVAVAIAVS